MDAGRHGRLRRPQAGAHDRIRLGASGLKPFLMECDASGSCFGTVLHQDAGAIAFFSRAVAPRHQALAAYERELIGLVYAVRH